MVNVYPRDRTRLPAAYMRPEPVLGQGAGGGLQLKTFRSVNPVRAANEIRAPKPANDRDWTPYLRRVWRRASAALAAKEILVGLPRPGVIQDTPADVNAGVDPVGYTRIFDRVHTGTGGSHNTWDPSQVWMRSSSTSMWYPSIAHTEGLPTSPAPGAQPVAPSNANRFISYQEYHHYSGITRQHNWYNRIMWDRGTTGLEPLVWPRAAGSFVEWSPGWSSALDPWLLPIGSFIPPPLALPFTLVRGTSPLRDPLTDGEPWGKAPWQDAWAVEVTPGGKQQTRPVGRTPPRPSEKEGKVAIPKWMWSALGAALAVTEAVDLVKAVWLALPSHLRTYGAKPTTPQQMLADIWKHWDAIDQEKMVFNIAYNQIEDAVIGRLMREKSRALKNLGKEHRFGPAWG